MFRKTIDNVAKRAFDPVNTFIDASYSKAPQKNSITNKTNVYHFDDTWNLGLLEQIEKGPENNRDCG